jgi:hypothetical protein
LPVLRREHLSKENRSYLRFACEIPGEARVQNRTVEKATIKDFSREGLRLILHNSRTPPGSNMDLRIDTPWRNCPAFVSGEVMWSQSSKNDREIGVKIAHIANNCKCDILDHLYTQWRLEMQYNQKKVN